MFIAHAFSGYLCTRQCLLQFKNQNNVVNRWTYYLLFGAFCSVLPDIDLLYFYTIDNMQHLHHSYWTHFPVFWAIVAGLIYSVSRWIFQKRIGVLCLILFMNTWLHLLLDTVAGGIYWFYPINDVNIQFVHITARYNWWILNFVIHWTFIIEICIMLAAIYTYFKNEYNGKIVVSYDETR